MESKAPQAEGATPDAQTSEPQCPLDGTKMGKHDWVWVYENTPQGRVWTDRIRCNHCKEERQTSRKEGDVIV